MDPTAARSLAARPRPRCTAPLLALLLLTTGCGAAGQGDAVYRSDQPAPVDDGNDLRAYIAQCEAVLGPIPRISCDPADPAPGTHVTRIPVLVGGRLLGFSDSEEEDALLAERAQTGAYLCDFPSLGGNFECAVGSTLVQYQDEANPNVQWVGLCRGPGEDNPGYDRFIGNGLIGANALTGEMCFFFGVNPDPTSPYLLPALDKDAPSSEALAPWVPPKDMPGSCLSCHPNNDPWVMTPWLQPDYMRQKLTDPAYPLALPEGVEVEDLMAARFIRQTSALHKTLLPEPLPPERTAWAEEEIIGDEGQLLIRQYRAVGSSYVQNEAEGQVKGRKGLRPESWDVNFRERLRLASPETSCAAGCHALGTEYFQTLAHNALSDEDSPYLSELMRTAGDSAAWMPPYHSDLETMRATFDGGAYTVPAITECPIPHQVEEAPAVELRCEDDGGAATLTWRYVNDYGQVPGRDDVRFDVAYAFGDREARGVSEADAAEGVMMTESEGVRVARDVAPEVDHGADYRVEIPFTPGVGALFVDLQPKRFCFEEPERRPFSYAPPTRVKVSLIGACR